MSQWVSLGDGNHQRICTCLGCDYNETSTCYYFRLTVDGVDHAVCPLCGDFGEEELPVVAVKTDKAVKGSDGYYHLNSATGPLLYVNLGVDAPYISMGTLVGAIGQYGTGFKRIFFNADGTPMTNADGSFKKEDYTDAMIAYALHADQTYGVYPLTEDLMYMLKNGGEYKGWYTPGNDMYLFADAGIEVDPALTWMFAVCYLK